jgi:hypothetical protein
MRWCFGDSPYTFKVLANINAGQIAHVPFLWLYEVISVTAESRRKGYRSITVAARKRRH